MSTENENKDFNATIGNSIWQNPESRKPLCYQSGDWDGKRSDSVLVELKNSNYVVAVAMREL